MKKRPILFNSEMVRAILKGRKTQTRRVVKEKWLPMAEQIMRINDHRAWHSFGYDLTTPFGEIGDRLWVRETYTIATGNGQYPVYRADAVEDDSGERSGFWIGDSFYRYEGTRRWFPSIHMPRSASRINLEITSVRVERLQEISEKDACADGGYSPITRDYKMPKFRSLWESIAKPGSTWADNPWV